jgi:hypothetical protein
MGRSCATRLVLIGSGNSRSGAIGSEALPAFKNWRLRDHQHHPYLLVSMEAWYLPLMKSVAFASGLDTIQAKHCMLKLASTMQLGPIQSQLMGMAIPFALQSASVMATSCYIDSQMV